MEGRIERCSQIQCLQCEAGCLGCIQYPGARPVPVGFVSRPSVPLSQVLSLIFSPPQAFLSCFQQPSRRRLFFFCAFFSSLPTTSSLTSFLNLILSQSSSNDAIPQAKQRPLCRSSKHGANLSYPFFLCVFCFERHEPQLHHERLSRLFILIPFLNQSFA